MDALLPLAGMRIVEISSFVAAPLGGMTLAQLGAEVIRVDPVGGGPDIDRWPLAPSGRSLYWAGLNKGKRSVTADLRSAEGRGIVARLAAECGTVLTNAPPRDGLGPDELAAPRPDLVHVQLLGRATGAPRSTTR
ncbi:CoA transferase [Actinomadura sp. CNU-125]|uniref:CoA transferase n=1 Tax=Actinomadura sp. CNU-125 TaxID=1904961 RepID=UPI0021CD1438|nr:CoA transferase [Actinomadura sp. CNU-125]